MKHVFSYLKKLTVFAVILTLAFSPLASIKGIHTASAQQTDATRKAVIDAGGTYGTDSAEYKAAVAANADTAGAADCGNFNGGIGVGIGNCVAGFIYIFTVGIGSAVAFVGASFFNLAVHISLDAGAYSLDFVSAGWTTARDIANMAFIFILIYLALTIMFQANTSGTMHTLATVIMIALIINFSFFFTRLVIDAGNILAVQFYNAITVSGNATPFQVGGSGSAVQIPDLTAGIMQGVDLQKALNSDSFKTFQASNNTAGGWIPYTIALAFLYISLGAMFFMLAAAFFMAGAKFLTRIVMLWFMIISAPLALVARASGMRQIEHYYHDWQGNLIRNAFYPVAFLFIFWILSRFMNDLGTGGAIAKLFQDLATPVAGNDALKEYVSKMAIFIANLGIRIGFVIAMMYIALEASKRFGVYGAQAAEKFGNTLSLGGLAGYTRGLGWAGRLAARPAVAPVTQGVGAVAYNLNKQLAGTRGLRTLTKPLREGVLQPLTKTSLVGERSIVQKKKEGEAKSLINAALKDPEGLTDQQKKDLNHISSDVFSTVSPARIQQLINSGAITDEGNNHIKAAKNFSDDEKHDIGHAWDNQKSREQIEQLKKINEKLGGLTTMMDDKETKVEDLLKKGIALDKKNTTALKTTFQTKLDEAHADQKGAEMRLQAAVTHQVEMEKSGSEADVKAAEGLVKEAKKLVVAAKVNERNSSDGLKKLDVKPPKEEKADDKH